MSLRCSIQHRKTHTCQAGSSLQVELGWNSKQQGCEHIGHLFPKHCQFFRGTDSQMFQATKERNKHMIIQNMIHEYDKVIYDTLEE